MKTCLIALSAITAGCQIIIRIRTASQLKFMEEIHCWNAYCVKGVPSELRFVNSEFCFCNSIKFTIHFCTEAWIWWQWLSGRGILVIMQVKYEAFAYSSLSIRENHLSIHFEQKFVLFVCWLTKVWTELKVCAITEICNFVSGCHS